MPSPHLRRSPAWRHALATRLVLACTADAALPDAAPAPECVPLGRDVDASLSVDMAPVGEVEAHVVCYGASEIGEHGGSC